VGRRVGRGDEGLDGDGKRQGQRRGDAGLGAVEGLRRSRRGALARRQRRPRRPQRRAAGAAVAAWGAGPAVEEAATASGWAASGERLVRRLGETAKRG
jgi:hypothetical protein